MGGKAFTHPPHSLYTPRFPTTLYNRLVAQFHDLLRDHFEMVGTPLPGPEKADHGDVDVVVAGLKASMRCGDERDWLKKILGATAAIGGGGGMGGSFAIPLEESDAEALASPTSLSDLPSPKQPHVQLDVTLTTIPLYAWSLFRNSHSDLWVLLGASIRPFGLTALPNGLHLRIRAIERLHRKKSRLWLTADPRATLEFLGYDDEKEVEQILGEEFESMDAMYGFVARGRLFRRETFERATVENGEDEEGREANHDDTAAEGNFVSKTKANDRRRMQKREGYWRFVQEYIPALPPMSSSSLPPNDSGGRSVMNKGDGRIMRDIVLEEALDRFGKRDEHKRRMGDWEMEMREQARRQLSREERKKESVELEIYFCAWRDWLRDDSAAAPSSSSSVREVQDEGR